MSVVVAIKENNIIYMGADSQITRGSSRRSFSNPNNYKIWRTKNMMESLTGGVGLVREMNIVKVASLIAEEDYVNDKIDYDYIVSKYVPDLFKLIEAQQLVTKDMDGLPRLNSSYLLAIKDKLYSIGIDGAILEIDDFAAIGSGASAAIGSLLSTEHLPPVERIKIAIKASVTNDIYVDYPIVISNTKSNQFEVTYENELILKEK